MNARIYDKYINEIAPALKQELNIENPMAIPRIEKVIVSMGLGRGIADKKILPAAQRELSMIVGQKPLVCRAKKSVSNFKLRIGYDIGLKVTLRRRRMYEFLDRLISVAIPRIRDFRGLNPNSFDGRGNYSMGITEQTIFPEVDADKVEFQQGMNITFVTSAKNDQGARLLLTKIGLPFRKDNAGKAA